MYSLLCAAASLREIQPQRTQGGAKGRKVVWVRKNGSVLFAFFAPLQEKLAVRTESPEENGVIPFALPLCFLRGFA
jgi:hypothetical protein